MVTSRQKRNVRPSSCDRQVITAIAAHGCTINKEKKRNKQVIERWIEKEYLVVAGMDKAATVVAGAGGGTSPAAEPASRTAVIGSSCSSQSLSTSGNLERKAR